MHINCVMHIRTNRKANGSTRQLDTFKSVQNNIQRFNVKRIHGDGMILTVDKRENMLLKKRLDKLTCLGYFVTNASLTHMHNHTSVVFAAYKAEKDIARSRYF